MPIRNFSPCGSFAPASDALQNCVKYGPAIFSSPEAHEIATALIEVLGEGEADGLFQDPIGEPAIYHRKSLHGLLTVLWAMGAAEFPQGDHSSAVRRRGLIIRVHSLIGSLRNELGLRKGNL